MDMILTLPLVNNRQEYWNQNSPQDLPRGWRRSKGILVEAYIFKATLIDPWDCRL